MGVTCEGLLQNHAEAWQQATIHPFLMGCREGSIQPAQFNTWLVQDFLFVKEFTRLVGHLLGAAPDEHLDVLLSGLVALKEELLWFQTKAAERSLNLTVPRQTTCEAYCQFMAGLIQEPYPVQATALWAIEYAYNQGWQLPGAMPEPYSEFADRWGNSGFTDYVQLLAAQANNVLATASDSTQALAENAFLQVASLEAAFWQMAFKA